jgi:hydroxymethylpyrimidine pyrophosphatase-like HAD family hydrolase
MTHERRFDAVVCDIDGCLGPETAAPMDAGALAKVAEYNRLAKERGDRPIVTVCTGRPQPFAECVCRVIGNDVLPGISEMGVWLYDPRSHAYLRDPTITAADLGAVAEATAWIERELGPSGVIIQPGKAASISIWHENTAYLMGLLPRLREMAAERKWPMRVSNSVAWINLDLAHVSKATGIERLMARTGLKRERLAGIGDTMGDLAIREKVAFFACPANADDRLKAKADFVSSKIEIEGVLEILEGLVG